MSLSAFNLSRLKFCKFLLFVWIFLLSPIPHSPYACTVLARHTAISAQNPFVRASVFWHNRTKKRGADLLCASFLILCTVVLARLKFCKFLLFVWLFVLSLIPHSPYACTVLARHTAISAQNPFVRPSAFWQNRKKARCRFTLHLALTLCVFRFTLHRRTQLFFQFRTHRLRIPQNIFRRSSC